ncbi:MAG: ribonuclease HII [Candidatus Nitronauta litoralis]|uniref:Ribonuclease HII n=1 Tax=Candidatus Nitronauta litoralis TaxID=2705533 RepID=A0A7T0G057_9BACT|nr:MAG: ribonuclease HII [Candidatus Nitronauta litoralis]
MEDFEKQAIEQGYQCIAGVDEAGRGPLAGPVTAAAIVLPQDPDLPGLDDSKKLTEERREFFYDKLTRLTDLWFVAVVDSPCIDEINILQATRLAMKQAVEKLKVMPDLVLVDGNQRIDIQPDQQTLVKGDQRCLSIAAASVLAKVTRDRLMHDYHRQFPVYGFEQHKGYGTKLHRDSIREHGPCEIHRKSFKGVKEYL